MKKNNAKLGLIITIFLYVFAFFVFPTEYINADVKKNIIIIVNKSCPLNSISKTELANIFKGKITRIKGKKFIPLNHRRGSRNRKAFIQKYLNSSSGGMERYWKKFILQGKGKPPKSMSGTRAILKVVSLVQNTISYILKGDLDGSVKVLKIL